MSEVLSIWKKAQQRQGKIAGETRLDFWFAVGNYAFWHIFNIIISFSSSNSKYSENIK